MSESISTTIMVNGHHTIQDVIDVNRSITLLGHGDDSTINGNGIGESTSDSTSFLLQTISKLITVVIKNLRFVGIGILKIMGNEAHIVVEDCSVKYNKGITLQFGRENKISFVKLIRTTFAHNQRHILYKYAPLTSFRLSIESCVFANTTGIILASKKMVVKVEKTLFTGCSTPIMTFRQPVPHRETNIIFENITIEKTIIGHVKAPYALLISNLHSIVVKSSVFQFNKVKLIIKTSATNQCIENCKFLYNSGVASASLSLGIRSKEWNETRQPWIDKRKKNK